EKTREAERAGILPPVEGLEYQRALLDAVALLNQKRQEMQMANSELAALLNLPSTTDFTLQDVANPALSGVPSQLDTLEQMALERRPELR
ncbi:TolC family protein, partial [Escherichia coli]|nr:TolC family protein [Escherichia coli]